MTMPLEKGHQEASRWFLIVRLLIMAAVVVAGAFSGQHVELLPILYVGLAVVGLSVVYFVWALKGRLPRVLLYTQLVLDVAVITLIARFSGGLLTPFRMLYFLPATAGATAVGRRGGTTIATAAVAGYLTLTLLPGASSHYISDGGVAARALIDTAVFASSLVIVASLIGFVAGRARASEQQLAATRSALDIANLRISSIVHSLGSGLLLVDREGRIVYLNRAGESILGLTEQDTQGTDYRETLAARFPPLYERIDRALMEHTTEMRSEFCIERSDGVRIPVGMSTSLLRDDDGEMRGVIGIFRDITEQRKIEERMRHADRLAALGEFSAGLAHEIRNPLNAIRGSVELLREMDCGGADEQKLMALVSREADSLNSVIESFLRFGRVEPGEKEPVRLDTVVDEVATLARNHPSYKPGIELNGEGLTSVESYVNAGQIRQALLNLVINAFESIEERGQVRLSVVSGHEFASWGLRDGYADEVAILVEDTGCGISEERQKLVFRPFHTTKKCGTGLGLAIVDKIVRSNDGRVTVDSTPGEGSRFVVYLPEERAGVDRSESQPLEEEAHARR